MRIEDFSDRQRRIRCRATISFRHEMGMPASSIRTYVTRLRARYREMLRAEVRHTVETEAEVDGELHELFRVLSGG